MWAIVTTGYLVLSYSNCVRKVVSGVTEYFQKAKIWICPGSSIHETSYENRGRRYRHRQHSADMVKRKRKKHSQRNKEVQILPWRSWISCFSICCVWRKWSQERPLLVPKEKENRSQPYLGWRNQTEEKCEEIQTLLRANTAPKDPKISAKLRLLYFLRCDDVKYPIDKAGSL